MSVLAVSSELHNTLCIVSLMILIILTAFWLLNQFRETYIHYQAAKYLAQQNQNDNQNQLNNNQQNNQQKQNILLLSSFDVRELRNILTNIHSCITIDPRQIRQILKHALGSSIVRDVPISKPDLHVSPCFTRTDEGYKFEFDYFLQKHIKLLNKELKNDDIVTESKNSELDTKEEEIPTKGSNIDDEPNDESKDEMKGDNNIASNEEEEEDIDEDALTYSSLKRNKQNRTNKTNKTNKFRSNLTDSTSNNGLNNGDTDNELFDHSPVKLKETVLENALNRKKNNDKNRNTRTKIVSATNNEEDEITDHSEITKKGTLCMEFYFGVPSLYFEELISLIDFNDAKNAGNLLSSKQLRKAHQKSLTRKVSHLSDKLHESTTNTKEKFKRMSSTSHLFRRASTQDGGGGSGAGAPAPPRPTSYDTDDATDAAVTTSGADNVVSDTENENENDRGGRGGGHDSGLELSPLPTQTEMGILSKKDVSIPDTSIQTTPDVTPDPPGSPLNGDNKGKDSKSKSNSKLKRKKSKKKNKLKDELTMKNVRPFSHHHSIYHECEIGSEFVVSHELLESTMSAIISSVAKKQMSRNNQNDPNNSNNANNSNSNNNNNNNNSNANNGNGNNDETTTLNDSKDNESYFFCILISYMKYERMNNDQNNINNVLTESKNAVIEDNCEISHLEIAFFDPPTALTRDNTVAGSSGANILRNIANAPANRGPRQTQRARGNMSSAINPFMSAQILVDFGMQRLVQYMDIFGLNSYKSTLEADGDDLDCKICFSAPRSVVLLPCRHCCVCKNCFKQINKCPMCRKEIKNSLRWVGAM